MPSENVKIRDIHVRKFRNHTQTDAVFGSRVNALLGQNGEGKTNLLEAISYLCLTKSFFGSADGTVLQLGEQGFEISGELEGDTGIRYTAGVRYDHSNRVKDFYVNNAKVERFSEVVGQFPVVVLAPESGLITAGGPGDRRRFLDFVISQASKVYLEDLLEYRRVLRQRNRLLLDAKLSRGDPGDMLETWNEELISRGTKIVHRRRVFLEELQPLVAAAYESIAGNTEGPVMAYAPSITAEDPLSEESIKQSFRRDLKRKAGEERRFGISMAGPHRDELALEINGLPVRSHASQGQHKTLLIALKVAEFLYLQSKRNEKPILLLDDIFTELDTRRTERLLALTGSVGQSFITTTGAAIFPSDFDWTGDNKRFVVDRGTLNDEKTRILAN